jgi:hypothetical protein
MEDKRQLEEPTSQEFTDGFKDLSTEDLELMVKQQTRDKSNPALTEALIRTICQREGIKYRGIHDDIFDKKEE